MTDDPLLWNMLLLLTTAVLLVLPFYPAWSEWRHPSETVHKRVDMTSKPPQTETEQGSLHLAPGASFQSLHATQIVLGSGTMPAPAPLPELRRWQPPKDARPWGLHGWHIGHHLDIPAFQQVPCALVVRGRLSVQGPGRIEGDVKARDGLRLGSGVRVEGNLFSEGDIRLEAGCSVTGLVMTEGRLDLAPGVVIGSLRQPTSVCADVIAAQGPVQVHGSLQARIRGSVACIST